MNATLNEISTRLAPLGLITRGVVRSTDGQAIARSETSQRSPVELFTLILVGNAGSAIWGPFTASAEYGDGRADPMDRWSERIAWELAEDFDAVPLFPFGGPPHHPFLTWARQAEGLHPSPLGLLIHPQFGLWHAYRFALGFRSVLELSEAVGEAPSPCLACAEQPCLSACPVDAFTGEDYRVDVCADHLIGEGDSVCSGQGCRSRLACPVGAEFCYQPDHAAFHMAAFTESRR